VNILHINNFHYLRGGSEAVYFNTSRIMKDHGHQTIFFSMDHNKNLPCSTSDYFVSHVDLSSNGNNPWNTVSKAFRVLYCFESKKKLNSLLDRYDIDIAHLHNIYHEISPSVIDVLKRRKIPMVMTLHDYKLVCASYSMIADGKPCESCAEGKYFYAVKNKCAKNSFSKSALAAFESYLHNNILKIYDKADCFIAPSKFLRTKLIEMGFKRDIVYLPNVIEVNNFSLTDKEEMNTSDNFIVYFGRLSQEKGLRTLLNAAKIVGGLVRIKMIGDGPIRKELEEKVSKDNIENVDFLGYMKGDKLFCEIKQSKAVVLPSEWYENNPMSVLEAFAMSKPVIGARIGGIPELVIDGVSGYTFEPGNPQDLAEKINLLIGNNDLLLNMGRNARELVEKNCNEEIYYNGLMSIYEKAISSYDN
jgi:glycosyltransferase involved in cell wall biosynthesis